MPDFPTPLQNTRLGFHYFPDHIHFRTTDLDNWIPELKSLGASWLTLYAPGDRAIPEHFINGVISAGVEPILQLNFSLAVHPKIEEQSLLLEAYARWGVHYVVIYDRPNRRASWPASVWAQSDLVERFLDRFLPLAEICVQCNLVPVFPPLTPGGDYWDTAFLRDSLQAIDRRGHYRVLENLVLGAYAIAGDRPLTWGTGGPEHWPGAKPYLNSPETEDQRGLGIHEWYEAITQAAIGESRRQILFGLSSSTATSKGSGGLPESRQIRRTLAMAQALVSPSTAKSGASSPLAGMEGLTPFPPYVLAGNFWLLAADPGSPHAKHAWFKDEGAGDRRAEALRFWKVGLGVPSQESAPVPTQQSKSGHPIRHYLLLPTFEWGLSDWFINASRPFIHKHKPTIGFSIEEARLARQVTVLGSSGQIPDSALDDLRAAGCLVERIDGDGITIATQLVER
jgi:hypothetical protein